MCKLAPFVAPGLCLVVVGCQTPLSSDGLFGSFSPNKTLVVDNQPADSQKMASTSKRHIGGRGWRNASTRVAEKEAQAPAIAINNVDRLREFLAQGDDAMQKGLHDDARIQYEAVLSIEPRHAVAHHMLGRISDMDRKFDEAERHYLDALSANPEDGYLLSDLGYSYLQQGRLDEARTNLTKAITLEPELSIAKVNLAAVYAYSGDQRGALAWLRQVGTEQQAQETLASIVSKPAPYVFNGAAGALAGGPDKFSITPEGEVLGADGKPLTTWEEVQSSMAKLREQGGQKRKYEEQLREYQERERIKQAMVQESAPARPFPSLNNDANLNQQLRDIAQASGVQRQSVGNTRPIHVDPSARHNGPGQFPTTNQHSNNFVGVQGARNHPQQIQTNASVDSRGLYADLLNPAGPSGFQARSSGVQGQAGFQGQPVGPNQSGQNFPPGAAWQSQQQLPSPQLTGGQQGLPGSIPGFSNQTVPPQQFEQQAAFNSVPGNQYAAPPLKTLPLPQNPVWNGQSGNFQPNQQSTAPNPAYFGQPNPPGNVTSQSGRSLNNQHIGQPQNQISPTGQVLNSQPNFPQGQVAVPLPSVQSPNGWHEPQYPVQQLGHETGQTPASIVRGRPVQQYSPAERQAMQLGMAADFGGLAPINTLQAQPSPQYQPSPNYGGQRPGFHEIPNAAPQNYDYGQQPSVAPHQMQQLPDRGYPGQVPPLSGQIPGQANIWAPGTPEHGQPATGQSAPAQTIADQSSMNPQTTEHWRNMPVSQAGTTMPAAFSNSTQPPQQQSQNWSQPDQLAPSWQNGALSSPTTNPDFGQPHMTDPYLRQTNSQSGSASDAQTVRTATWDMQQPAR